VEAGIINRDDQYAFGRRSRSPNLETEIDESVLKGVERRIKRKVPQTDDHKTGR
jgi:hypothetical protein